MDKRVEDIVNGNPGKLEIFENFKFDSKLVETKSKGYFVSAIEGIIDVKDVLRRMNKKDPTVSSMDASLLRCHLSLNDNLALIDIPDYINEKYTDLIQIDGLSQQLNIFGIFLEKMNVNIDSIPKSLVDNIFNVANGNVDKDKFKKYFTLVNGFVDIFISNMKLSDVNGFLSDKDLLSDIYNFPLKYAGLLVNDSSVDFGVNLQLLKKIQSMEYSQNESLFQNCFTMKPLFNLHHGFDSYDDKLNPDLDKGDYKDIGSKCTPTIKPQSFYSGLEDISYNVFDRKTDFLGSGQVDKEKEFAIKSVVLNSLSTISGLDGIETKWPNLINEIRLDGSKLRTLANNTNIVDYTKIQLLKTNDDFAKISFISMIFKGDAIKDIVISFLKKSMNLSVNNRFEKFIEKNYENIVTNGGIKKNDLIVYHNIFHAITNKNKKQVLDTLKKINFDYFSDNSISNVISLIWDDSEFMNENGFTNQDIQEFKSYSGFMLQLNEKRVLEKRNNIIPLIKENSLKLVRFISNTKGTDSLKQNVHKVESMFQKYLLNAVDETIKFMLDHPESNANFLSIMMTNLHKLLNNQLKQEVANGNGQLIVDFIQAVGSYADNIDDLRSLINKMVEEGGAHREMTRKKQLYDELYTKNKELINQIDPSVLSAYFDQVSPNTVISKDKVLMVLLKDKLQPIINKKYMQLQSVHGEDIIKIDKAVKELYLMIANDSIDINTKLSHCKKFLTNIGVAENDIGSIFNEVESLITSNLANLNALDRIRLSDKNIGTSFTGLFERRKQDNHSIQRIKEEIKSPKFEQQVKNTWKQEINEIKQETKDNVEKIQEDLKPTLQEKLVTADKVFGDKKDAKLDSDDGVFIPKEFNFKQNEINGVYELQNPFYDEKNDNSIQVISGPINQTFKIRFMYQYLVSMGININSFQFTNDDFVKKVGIDLNQYVDQSNFNEYFNNMFNRLQRFMGKYCLELIKSNYSKLPETLPSQVGFKKSIKDCREQMIEEFINDLNPKRGLKEFFDLIKGKESYFGDMKLFVSNIKSFSLDSISNDYAKDINSGSTENDYFKLESHNALLD